MLGQWYIRVFEPISFGNPRPIAAQMIEQVPYTCQDVGAKTALSKEAETCTGPFSCRRSEIEGQKYQNERTGDPDISAPL
jgi:hypothetical protein